VASAQEFRERSLLPVAMAGIQNAKMNNGTDHPLIGFGTYKIGFVPASSNTANQPGHSPDQDPAEIIKEAIEVGYRYIDCAQFYGNEKMVGTAIKASGVPRKDLFIASKVWGDKIYEGEDAVRQQFERTVSDLGCEYLDLYLVHWPVPGKHVACYKVLEQLLQEGRVRAIGVSNYTIEDYQELQKEMKVKPVVNQIEINPFLYRKKTIDFFQKEGVLLQSYRALRQGKGLDDPRIRSVAEKHGKTAAQVLGRWCVQKGIVVVAKTVKRERMLENLGVFDFTLDESDVSTLDGMTTPDTIEEYRALYFKCIVRDTPLEKAPPEHHTVTLD